MISQRLFEEVFNGCAFGDIEDNYIIKYSQPCIIMEGSWVESEVNISEFLEECYLWAYSKGYEIVRLSHTIKVFKNGYEVYFTETKLYSSEDYFKVCEWILNEVKGETND